MNHVVAQIAKKTETTLYTKRKTNKEKRRKILFSIMIIILFLLTSAMFIEIKFNLIVII